MSRAPAPAPVPVPALGDSALLTAAEETDLANTFARGDSAARDRLVTANLRLVIKIARDYAGRGLDLDDLVGEGNLGLIRAAEGFDPYFGVRFSTYASYWIKQAIRAALTNTAATIRLPAHMVDLLTRWRRAERALRRELGTEPHADQVADRLRLTAAQRQMVERARRARQIRRPADRPADEPDWTSEASSGLAEDPGLALEASEERSELRGRLNRIDARSRAIVGLRFGLDGGEPQTLKEVGRRLGVTREWVRKLEARALRTLGGETAVAERALGERLGFGDAGVRLPSWAEVQAAARRLGDRTPESAAEARP
jgi:RNA polymerase primary sigma factor